MTPQHDVKVPVVQRKSYTLFLERYNSVTYLHADVSDWSATTCRDMRRDLAALAEMQGGKIYAHHGVEPWPVYEKWRRFIALVGGWRHCGETIQGREIWVWHG